MCRKILDIIYDMLLFMHCLLIDSDSSKGTNKEMSSIGSQSIQPTSMTENNEVNVIVGRDMINLTDCTAPQIRYDKQWNIL